MNTLTRSTILILTILFAWIACLIIRRRSIFYSTLSGLLGIAFFTELLGIIMQQLGMHNNALYNVFCMVDIGVFLYLSFLNDRRFKTPLFIIGVISAAAFLLSGMGRNLNEDFLTEGLLVSFILAACTSLFMMYQIATNSQEQLLSIPEFWFFLASLIYFGGAVPMLGANTLIHDLDPNIGWILYWIIPVSAMVRYSMIGYCCILERRRVKLEWSQESK